MEAEYFLQQKRGLTMFLFLFVPIAVALFALFTKMEIPVDFRKELLAVTGMWLAGNICAFIIMPRLFGFFYGFPELMPWIATKSREQLRARREYDGDRADHGSFMTYKNWRQVGAGLELQSAYARGRKLVYPRRPANFMVYNIIYFAGVIGLYVLGLSMLTH